MMPVMTSMEFDDLLERRRTLERSVRRAREVLASEPNPLLESACAQAVEALDLIRTLIEEELAEVRSRARSLRSAVPREPSPRLNGSSHAASSELAGRRGPGVNELRYRAPSSSDVARRGRSTG
jgi:hypothetical protein